MSSQRRRIRTFLAITLFGLTPLVYLLVGGEVGFVAAWLIGNVILISVLFRIWLSIDRSTTSLSADVHSGRQHVEAALQSFEHAASRLISDSMSLRQLMEKVEARSRAFEQVDKSHREVLELQYRLVRMLDLEKTKREEYIGSMEVALSRLLAREGGRTVTEVRADLRRLFQQMEALGALYSDIQPSPALPPTRSWVASPDLLHYLYVQCRELRPQLILECGSGLSTVVLAYALRASGHGGKVVAMEHDTTYADITRRLLASHSVGDFAEVRLAPLEPVELAGETWPWYRLTAVPDGPIDLVVVDGPPGSTRSQARYPAVPLLYEQLSGSARVILDDFARDDEREIVERWQNGFPDLKLTEIGHEKGTAVLAR